MRNQCFVENVVEIFDSLNCSLRIFSFKVEPSSFDKPNVDKDS